MTKKDCFYGIYPIRFVWHGCWNDPELLYKKHSFNYWDIERFFYNEFSESGTNLTFEEWIYQNRKRVKEHLDFLIECV